MGAFRISVVFGLAEYPAYNSRTADHWQRLSEARTPLTVQLGIFAIDVLCHGQQKASGA